MTNSPPPNVKHWSEVTGRILASGIDSLVLAIGVWWESDATFKALGVLKERAKKAQDDEPAILTMEGIHGSWVFNVKPHGSNGYEWVLSSRELTMKIGNWQTMRQRPSVMVDIRAETLWTHGAQAVVDRIQACLSALGAKPLSVKPSRADLARDMLIAEDIWTMDLIHTFVTRAQDMAIYFKYRKLSGFTVGSDNILVRIYDKALEIKKSKKVWMYDVWGLDGVPEGQRAIRAEIQMRRPVLHSLGSDSWDQFKSSLSGIWAYGTRKWLRSVEDATLHHTQQVVSPWWLMVATDFTDTHPGTPLVRTKAIQQDILQLATQTLGTLSSIATIVAKDSVIEGKRLLNACRYTQLALKVAAGVSPMSDETFTERVKKKHARYARHQPETSTSQKKKNRARVARVIPKLGGLDP